MSVFNPRTPADIFVGITTLLSSLSALALAIITLSLTTTLGIPFVASIATVCALLSSTGMVIAWKLLRKPKVYPIPMNYFHG